MANEFIARKGLIVLANGAKVTGSLGVQGDINATGYNVTASNLQLLGSASINGDITIGGNLTVGNADLDVVKFLAEVSSSIVPDVNNAFDLGSGSKYWKDLYVSGTAYIGTVQANTINLDSITVLEDLTVEGNTNLGNALTDKVIISGSVINTGSISSTSISGSFSGSGAQITNIPNSGLDNSDITVTAGSGLEQGGTVSLGSSVTVALDTSSAHFVTGARATISSTDTTGASGIDLRYNPLTGVISGSLVNSSITVNAGSGLTQGGTVSLGGSVTVALDTGSATFNDGVKTKLNTEGVFSSSVQTDVRNTTGIATIATTGSNTFTGIQTINDTTNSTNFTDGALVVAGGAGFGKDVNISGSLTVEGLLTAVSMSTQYVTSSQYTIGVSRIVLNDDDLVRFAGMSVVDSGSTSATGSLLWDSLRNHWIYENASGSSYNSAILIAGPKTTGSLGSEPELITGRIPVASGGDHIDTNPALTPLRVEGTTLHVEENVYVTGSVTASGFAGDGSNLTGIVTNLNITGSDGGTGTVSLKTQALTIDGTNGLTATVSGQTITISGSDATTTTKGVASFTGSNFDVNGGVVSALPITFNGVPLNLGSAYGFGLQNITPQGATTADQLTLNGGAIIHGTLFTSGSNSDIDSGTEVVASIGTGSRDVAFFDYVVKKGSNYRAGTVMAVWDGANNVEFTDTSTNDLGNTNDVSFTVDALSGAVRLKATVTSNDWIVKTSIRAF